MLQLIFFNRKINRRIVAGIFLLICGVSPALSAENNQIATISLSATGTAEVAPDMAVLNLEVLREAKTARQALSANNKAMGGVIKALKQIGIAQKDLQTANFNIYPRYRPQKSNVRDNSGPQIIGYAVNNGLTVRIRDLTILGPVLDKVVTLGVNSGGNVQFLNQDSTEAIAKARARAMKNAMAKAQTLIWAAGVKLGDIMSISEGRQNNRPVPVAMARVAQRSAAESVPLATGENSYSVTVNVSWKIIQ